MTIIGILKLDDYATELSINFKTKRLNKIKYYILLTSFSVFTKHKMKQVKKMNSVRSFI